jgi:uncharacterized protein with von Willebrand factor type A (vWA) domain
MYGYGYRYPRRGRRAEVETFIKKEDREPWARAAIFNRAIASRNPWIRYLEDHGVYDQISLLLRNAREGYRAEKGPEDEETKKKKEKAVQRRIKQLQEEVGILKEYQANPGKLLQQYQGKKFANDVKFSEAVLDEIEKLENQIRELQGVAPMPTQRYGRILQRREELRKLGKLK